jgi:hypothetical protein
MRVIGTSNVVAIMLMLSFGMSLLAVYLRIPTFFIYIFLVPTIVAVYLQRKHGIRFEKIQRKRISIWYIVISSVYSIIATAIFVNQRIEQLNPLSQVLTILVVGNMVLFILGYYMVYWIFGMNFIKNNHNP